jgi:hypothetical protein
MSHQPKEESNFGPVFKIPNLLPNSACMFQARVNFYVIGFTRSVGTSWSMSPSKDVFSRQFGYFPFKHLCLIGTQVHLVA